MIWLVIYLFAFCASLTLSFIVKHPRGSRLSRFVTFLLGLPVGLAIVAMVLLVCLGIAMQPPSLGSLQRHFQSRKADLEKIVKMSDEDSNYSRIAPTFLDWDKASGSFGRYMEGDPKAGLPEGRWNAYRAIYARADIKLGVQRDDAGDAFIMVDSFGLLNRGHTTGYLYCRNVQGQADRFQPCTQHADEGSHQFNPDPREEGYSFRRIQGPWFAYDEGPS